MDLAERLVETICCEETEGGGLLDREGSSEGGLTNIHQTAIQSRLRRVSREPSGSGDEKLAESTPRRGVFVETITRGVMLVTDITRILTRGDDIGLLLARKLSRCSERNPLAPLGGQGGPTNLTRSSGSNERNPKTEIHTRHRCKA